MRSTTRRTTTLAVAAALALGLAACGDDAPADDPAVEAPADDAAPADDDEPADDDAAAAGNVVDMDFFQFQPEDLTVAVGDTVTWVNKDSVRHTATADDGTFDVDTPAEGDEGSFTFDEAGTYAYVCEVHASMTGTITVE